MKITEVRIKLMEGTEDRLRGFCSITFDDCFVVRDLKIILGNSGPFVAMPSRKLSSHCHKCRSKNHLKARYCNNCGSRQRSDHVPFDGDGRAKLYADVAHPVNAECREMIQARVIEEYNKELDRAQTPGYRSRYDDGYDIPDPHLPDQTMVKPRSDSASTPSGPHNSPKKPSESVKVNKTDEDSAKEFGNGITD